MRPDEVLVEVQACALNRLDLAVRNGIPGIEFPMPHIPGSDIAGEIVAAGGECRRVRPGWRVVLSPGLSCRQCPACLDGRDNECRDYQVFGYGRSGGNAELVTAPEYAVLQIPDAMAFEQAAAAPLVFLTAWHMLMTRARLQPGEDVLVLAAASGVGSAAIQLAKLFGCRVLTTARGEAKAARARELGADHVIDPTSEDLAARTRALTSGRGAGVVVEHVGAATWPKSLQALARGGRLVTCGCTTGFDARVDLRYLFTKQWSLLGSFMGTMGELRCVMDLVFAGRLRPVVDSVFPMQEIRAAHERLEQSGQFGKVIVQP